MSWEGAELAGQLPYNSGMTDTETLVEGRFLRLVRKGRWEFVQRVIAPEGAVQIIALTPAGEILFVEQDRPPVGGRVLELPAGLIDGDGGPDETAEATAIRELEEETGYACERVRLVHRGPTSPGSSNEFNAFFVAEGLRRIGEGGGLDSEDITVHRVPLASAHDWLAQQAGRGLYIDPRAYTGIYWAQRELV